MCSEFDVLLFDLDGVVYVGPDAVPHAAESIAAARNRGVACAFITNNASRTAIAVAQHLTDLGVRCSAADVVTSPQAAVTVLGDFVPPGARVLVIGGSGIAEVLSERGYVPVASLEEEPDAVMQGFSPDLGWRDLAEATFAVRRGLPWIATNRDFTFPTPGGAAPGNGALVELVAQVAGREPDAVAGKPEPPLLREAVARTGGQRPLMVGDRLDTDIEAGYRVGIPTLLVLTGVTSPAQVLQARPHERPTYIGSDLRVLDRPYATPVLDEGGRRAQGHARARCGAAQVEQDGQRMVVRSGSDPVEILRAAAVLAWSLVDSGIDLADVNLTSVLGAVATARSAP